MKTTPKGKCPWCSHSVAVPDIGGNCPDCKKPVAWHPGNGDNPCQSLKKVFVANTTNR